MARQPSIRQQVVDLIKPESASDELLAPAPVPVRKHASLLVEFPGFVTWFRGRRGRNSQTVRVGDVVEYRRAKKDYETDVTFAIYEIASHPVGQALLAEFDMTPSQTVSIHPWANEDEANSSASADDPNDATSVGMPKLDTRGRPSARRQGSGTGEGSDATVNYTASMWGADGTARATGPGTGKDELLLHELVHAARSVVGVHYRLPVNLLYDNEEEFLAVFITNIYLSNKGQKKLRANHHGHDALRDPEQFLDNMKLSPTPRTLMERLRLKQPRLFKALAAIPAASAAFNPVRQYAEERAQGKLLGTGSNSPFAAGRSTTR